MSDDSASHLNVWSVIRLVVGFCDGSCLLPRSDPERTYPNLFLIATGQISPFTSCQVPVIIATDNSHPFLVSNRHDMSQPAQVGINNYK